MKFIDSKFKLYNISFLKIDFKYFINYNLIYQVLVSYNSNYRQGSNNSKNRSLVRYSKKKIYNQKGTGKSRAGSKGTVIRRGGGMAFPSSINENFSKKINKKMYKTCLKNLFNSCIKLNNFFIIEDNFFVKPSSKKIYFNFLVYKNFTYISNYIDKNFFLSIKNFYNFKLNYFFNISLISIIKYKNIFLSLSSFYNFNRIYFL